MIEHIEWKDIYTVWQYQCENFPESPSSPVKAEPIFVKFKQDGYIYGFDWVENEEAKDRKHLISQDPIAFLTLTKQTGKGIIQTAEMLLEARCDEERAAIWIAATAKELLTYDLNTEISFYANMIFESACEFLKDKYHLWNEYRKHLIPGITIPKPLLNSIECKDIFPLIGLIQVNTLLIKKSYTIFHYYSDLEYVPEKSNYRIS